MQPNSQLSLAGVAGRIFWIMIGPMTGIVLLFAIINVGHGWFTWADIAFLSVLGGLILGRWLEFQSGAAQTATGEPATPAHLKKYALVVIVVGVLVWVGANLVANEWITV